MEDKIPIPTDNIFKFYALFGLLLFVFSIGSTIYIVHSTNEFAFQAAVGIATVQQTPNPSLVDTTKRQFLEKRLEIALEERKFSENALGALCAGAMLLMAYGFWKWHTAVQPIQDEMAKLQLEKLRHELRKLKQAGAP